MFRVAVCDDDEWICTKIKEILMNARFDQCGEISVRCCCSGEELCAELRMQRFDLLILDIELEKMSGIAVAQYVRESLHDYQVQILYISAKQQYCMDLFESMPLHFLVKPLDEKEVVRLVQKAIFLKQEESYFFQF